MIKNFKEYLISKGYKEFTPSGHPSTAYDYCKRIRFVMETENYLSFNNVVNDIDKLLIDYGPFGCKAKLGAISHNSVISALRRFKEFILENKI